MVSGDTVKPGHRFVQSTFATSRRDCLTETPCFDSCRPLLSPSQPRSSPCLPPARPTTPPQLVRFRSRRRSGAAGEDELNFWPGRPWRLGRARGCDRLDVRGRAQGCRCGSQADRGLGSIELHAEQTGEMERRRCECPDPPTPSRSALLTLHFPVRPFSSSSSSTQLSARTPSCEGKRNRPSPPLPLPTLPTPTSSRPTSSATADWPLGRRRRWSS